GASQTALRALAFSKPIIAPGHAGFAAYLPDEYPYRFATYPTTLRFIGDPQGREDPSSTWHMPAPFALADALVRFTEDTPECRAEAAERAGAIVKRQCERQGIAAMLAEEMQRLEAGQYRRVEDKWGRDIIMQPPRAPERRRVRHESVARGKEPRGPGTPLGGGRAPPRGGRRGGGRPPGVPETAEGL